MTLNCNLSGGGQVGVAIAKDLETKGTLAIGEV